MDDLIRREDAIKAIMGDGLPELHYASWFADMIMTLPTAEPERKSEKSGGLIDRQKAINIIDLLYKKLGQNADTFYIFVLDALKEMEPESMERKMGKWIWSTTNGYYFCNICRAIAPRYDQDGGFIDRPNFCPNCGAKMEVQNG